MEHLFIVGAQRSGSTLLYKLLDSSNDILMAKPLSPEPKFFLREFGSKCIKDIKLEYEARYFGHRSFSGSYYGEKSTSYIESEKAAISIKKVYPESRIIIILRDPVERAISNYRLSLYYGIESESLTDAIGLEDYRLKNAKYSQSVNPYAYRLRGEYPRYIKTYINYFGEKSIKVIILEELVKNSSILHGLTDWLGIGRINGDKFLNIRVNSSSGSEIVNDRERAVLGKYYKPIIKELEDLLGRDLNIWLGNEWYNV